MKLEDAYKVLGLERGCDGDDIRRAFRKQALIWHPDKNSNNGDCTERFQRIQAAYAKLTRELSEHYADDSDDEYCDEFVNDDDDEDCDYDCDCFFHGGIPPWEFFEQLFAAMESGHYGPPQGGFAPRQEAPRAARHSCHHQCDLGEHCMHHCDCEADPHHCEYAYGFESRDERRHREREEQKLEKMWRKEMEMAERESIRAANAAKAAKSLAQERNLRAWMRQMPRPTMASRSDTTIELLLTRRGIANDELPVTCVCKMEWRKSNDSAWSQRLISKDEYRVTMEGLDPGTMYVFRICGGRRNKDRPDEWGEVSVESRYATTGKPPAVQSEGGHVPERSKKHGAGRGGAANRTARVAAAAADKPHRGAAPPPSGGPQSEEDRLRQQEKELAIQKALEAAAAEYEETQKTFQPAEASSAKKKKKKKAKSKSAAEAHISREAGAEHSSAVPRQRQVEGKASGDAAAEENEELVRALEESLTMYKESLAAKEAVAQALGQEFIDGLENGYQSNHAGDDRTESSRQAGPIPRGTGSSSSRTAPPRRTSGCGKAANQEGPAPPFAKPGGCVAASQRSRSGLMQECPTSNAESATWNADPRMMRNFGGLPPVQPGCAPVGSLPEHGLHAGPMHAQPGDCSPAPPWLGAQQGRPLAAVLPARLFPDPGFPAAQSAASWGNGCVGVLPPPPPPPPRPSQLPSACLPGASLFGNPVQQVQQHEAQASWPHRNPGPDRLGSLGGQEFGLGLADASLRGPHAETGLISPQPDPAHLTGIFGSSADGESSKKLGQAMDGLFAYPQGMRGSPNTASPFLGGLSSQDPWRGGLSPCTGFPGFTELGAPFSSPVDASAACAMAPDQPNLEDPEPDSTALAQVEAFLDSIPDGGDALQQPKCSASGVTTVPSGCPEALFARPRYDPMGAAPYAIAGGTAQPAPFGLSRGHRIPGAYVPSLESLAPGSR